MADLIFVYTQGHAVIAKVLDVHQIGNEDVQGVGKMEGYGDRDFWRGYRFGWMGREIMLGGRLGLHSFECFECRQPHIPPYDLLQVTGARIAECFSVVLFKFLQDFVTGHVILPLMDGTAHEVSAGDKVRSLLDEHMQRTDPNAYAMPSWRAASGPPGLRYPT